MLVALESTVIAHGLPRPHNLDAARACERAVRESGARPATVAVVAGRPAVGLTEAELVELASREGVEKVSLRNLGAVVARGAWGATTVAATIHLSSRAGVRVFATGGIGGVHRGAERTFDVSADLSALAGTPVVAVCAGAKSILDLPRTLELLETLGVPVVGYGTQTFPAFYATTSGLPVPLRADAPGEVAEIAKAHWALGLRSAILVAAPCPEDAAIREGEVAAAVESALAEAEDSGVTGAALTPFLLGRVAAATSGRALRANLALLENNARIAGEIAVALGAEGVRGQGPGVRDESTNWNEKGGDS
jgi:pseudouridine-5'-phosphate glycosidase